MRTYTARWVKDAVYLCPVLLAAWLLSGCAAPERESSQPSPSATASPVVMAASPVTPDTATLLVGGTQGAGLYIRRLPGSTGEAIRSWPDGTPLTVVGSTLIVEGRMWTKVTDPAGNLGWVASEFLVATGSARPTASPRPTLTSGATPSTVASPSRNAPSVTPSTSPTPLATPTPFPSATPVVPSLVCTDLTGRVALRYVVATSTRTPETTGLRGIVKERAKGIWQVLHLVVENRDRADTWVDLADELAIVDGGGEVYNAAAAASYSYSLGSGLAKPSGIVPGNGTVEVGLLFDVRPDVTALRLRALRCPGADVLLP